MQSIRANGEHYLSYSLAESPSGELRYQSSPLAALVDTADCVRKCQAPDMRSGRDTDVIGVCQEDWERSRNIRKHHRILVNYTCLRLDYGGLGLI